MKTFFAPALRCAAAILPMLLCGAAAWAQLTGDAPAATAQPAAQPAAPAAAHANQEHPAVTAWRQAQQGRAGIDANHFLVQPPAMVTWTVLPSLDAQRLVQR